MRRRKSARGRRRSAPAATGKAMRVAGRLTILELSGAPLLARPLERRVRRPAHQSCHDSAWERKRWRQMRHHKPCDEAGGDARNVCESRLLDGDPEATKLAGCHGING